MTVREKCPNTELFLVRIFPYWKNDTARKMCKYGVISGLYFPAFGLNTESVFSPNVGKYGSEITPYLGTFHAV